MKKSLCFLLSAVAPLLADYDLENVSGWEIGHQVTTPYDLEISGDWIGDSKFTKDSVDGDHLRYETWEAEFEAVAYWDQCHNEGANLAFFYEQSRLEWECNPFFDRRNFNTAGLSLLFYTERFSNWTWVGQARYLIDANNWGFIDYSAYDWLLWGRWSYCEQIGLHAGVFAQTGMRLPLVLPLLGFDWQFQSDWKLALIFPVNLSLTYKLDDCCSISLRGRYWSDRHRVGKHAHLSKAVWRYTNYGAEVGTHYSLNSWLEADLHGGCAFGGKVKVANRRGHETKNFRFKPAAYVGGELVASF